MRSHECQAALVSTRAIDAAIRDDGVKWWLVPPCMLGVALPKPTTAGPWMQHNGGMMNIDALMMGLYGVHYSFAVQHGADATELLAVKAVCATAF